MFNWQEGRQGSGYRKALLATSKFLKFDLYLLHYPDGSYIAWHTDPAVEGYEHHRINITLKKPRGGGQFITRKGNVTIMWKSRIVKFRPDITEHCVSMCHGERYVLSLGWLRKK